MKSFDKQLIYGRFIFLLYALKSAEIGQFSHAKLAYCMSVTFNISAAMMGNTAESWGTLFVARQQLHLLLKYRKSVSSAWFSRAVSFFKSTNLDLVESVSQKIK